MGAMVGASCMGPSRAPGAAAPSSGAFAPCAGAPLPRECSLTAMGTRERPWASAVANPVARATPGQRAGRGTPCADPFAPPFTRAPAATASPPPARLVAAAIKRSTARSRSARGVGVVTPSLLAAAASAARASTRVTTKALPRGSRPTAARARPSPLAQGPSVARSTGGVCRGPPVAGVTARTLAGGRALTAPRGTPLCLASVVVAHVAMAPSPVAATMGAGGSADGPTEARRTTAAVASATPSAPRGLSPLATSSTGAGAASEALA